MHADNLAVVFAPTIMRNDEINNEQSTTSLNDIVIQKKLVSYLIKNVYDLFCMCEWLLKFVLQKDYTTHRKIKFHCTLHTHNT